MKRFVKTGNLCLMLLICFYGCKNRWPENKYLGEIPAIAARYQEKIETLEKKTDNCYNLEKAYEYAIRAKNLSKEAEQKIGEAFDELPDPALIPVIQDQSEAGFSIREVRVVAASRQALRLEAVIICGGTAPLADTISICGLNEKGLIIEPAVLLCKSNATTQNSMTIFSGVVPHPENFTHLEVLKIVCMNPK